MDLWIALLAALVGYLSGSISFARLIAGRVKPGTELSQIRHPIPNTDIVFESDSVSATMVRMQVGTRYGCLTAILDMLKVALPTLLFRLWLPDAPYYLIVAAAGLVGHDWPLYHRFQGGRGESAIIGGMAVIDPLGLVVTNVLGSALGWLLGDVLVLRWSFLLLLIPWFWLRTDGWAFVAYAVVVNVIYWGTMLPELKQFLRVLKEGGLGTQEEVAGDMAMGLRLGRFLDQYGAPALIRRGVRSLRGDRSARK
jgi:glycerol-3-phosphate acyltransferase PlsY